MDYEDSGEYRRYLKFRDVALKTGNALQMSPEEFVKGLFSLAAGVIASLTDPEECARLMMEASADIHEAIKNKGHEAWTERK